MTSRRAKTGGYRYDGSCQRHGPRSVRLLRRKRPWRAMRTRCAPAVRLRSLDVTLSIDDRTRKTRSILWSNTMQALTDFSLKLLTGLRIARWSPIPLRLIVGYGFMQHGFAKLSRGPGAFASVL